MYYAKHLLIVLCYNNRGIRPGVDSADTGFGIRRPLYKSGLWYL